ncbi:MAG: hypothetical protein ACI4HO_09100 [Ruminococcus sp.]
MSKKRRIRPYSGFNKKTVDHLLLDAGAFFKNFIVGKDTYASAKAEGKCLGATSGGGEFAVVNTYRQGEFDGVRSRVKGNQFVDSTDVSIKATVAEITEDILIKALGTADVVPNDIEGYKKIEGRSYVVDEDYIENITWVGTLLGSDKPVIIQVYNAFNENGLTMAVADKGQASVELQFYGNLEEGAYDSTDDEDVKPPYAIYYPVETQTSNTVETQTSNTVEAQTANSDET